VKENIVLKIVKKETLEPPKIYNHQDENIIAHFLFSWSKHRKMRGIPLMGLDHIPPSFWKLGP